MTQALSGQVSVVTGGSSGIGRAIVEAFVGAGARVVVADLQPPAALQSEAVIFTKCDVTQPNDIANAIKAAKEKWGSLDIMVNNAGVSGGAGWQFPAGQPRQAWVKMLDINLTAVIEGTQQAMNAMTESKKGGVIINIASMGGLLPMPQSPVYGASKAGVIHFTRSLVDIGQPHGIRINAVCPTFTETPLVRENSDQIVESLKQMIGGRLLQPSEVAQGVIELVTDNKLTGAVMRITVRGKSLVDFKSAARL